VHLGVQSYEIQANSALAGNPSFFSRINEPSPDIVVKELSKGF
jgi:hypothetical protein